MNHRSTPAITFTRRKFVQSLVASSALFFVPNIWARKQLPTHAEGFVFHDRNGSGKWQPGRGLAGVAVSNGREICLTDKKGRWRLPIEGEQTTFFVIKPRNWMTSLSKDHLPRAFYIHQPEGSPKLQFPGVRPSGPLPELINFPLTRSDEPDRFKALICGDPQPRDATEISYLARSVVPQFAGTNALFGVSLGDIMFNNLSLYNSLIEVMGLIGIPWHNVVGNHDLNQDSADNRFSTETFRSVFGPTYYSFDCGPVHFLVLNNVEWMGRELRPGPKYQARFGERQLEFIKNDLKFVPQDRLTVLMFHIPLHHGFDPNAKPGSPSADRQALYRLIENRPNTISFSAHTHAHNNWFFDHNDGWRGAKPHHHVNTGTLCGSWFAGLPDERGIPYGTMADGTPRGYLEVEFDANRYNIDGYRVLQRPKSHQMNITAPPEIAREKLGETTVYVNVFNGSVRSKVRVRFGEGDQWRDMEKVIENDPAFVKQVELSGTVPPPYHRFPGASVCSHLWRAPLPADLPVGTHAIEVLAKDMFGNEHSDVRPIRIEG